MNPDSTKKYKNKNKIIIPTVESKITITPEVERLTIKPTVTPILPSTPAEGERADRHTPAPESLRNVPVTPRLLFACGIVNSLMKRHISAEAIATYLVTVRFTRSEAESAWRLCAYMKSR